MSACQRGLRVIVLACQRGFYANVLACHRGLRANVPKASQLLICTCHTAFQCFNLACQGANFST